MFCPAWDSWRTPMLRTMLSAKIHRAVVTHANVQYQGSITIDSILLKEAGILPGERVQVVDVDNGARLETYVMEGAAGKGDIQMNGAAARLVKVGDRVIIMAFAALTTEELAGFKPRAVFVDDANHVVETRELDFTSQVGQGDC